MKDTHTNERNNVLPPWNGGP